MGDERVGPPVRAVCVARSAALCADAATPAIARSAVYRCRATLCLAACAGGVAYRLPSALLQRGDCMPNLQPLELLVKETTSLPFERCSCFLYRFLLRII